MSIDVVYLAYFNDQIEYKFEIAELFLKSYINFSAGIKHSLTIIAKNWTKESEYNKLCILAKKANANIINLPDDGWDFGAYFRAAKLLTGDYVLFLGSTSQIVCNDWLRKLYNPFKTDNSIQLVGPMGSWEDLKREEFPNYHIRTCAFMLKRDLFLEYADTQKFPATKDDTYEMEHGKNSITKFILNKGYKAVVVNNEGQIFLPENWVESKTFRYPGEWKPIIVDKISAYYHTVDDNYRHLLESVTWGKILK